MEKLILVARPGEITSLIQWVCDEYYHDVPTNDPVIADTIRQKTGGLLQSYFVRDQGDDLDVTDTFLTDVLSAIGRELTEIVAKLTQKGFNICAVDTFNIDGSTRFVLTMIGENHEQSLPDADTG